MSSEELHNGPSNVVGLNRYMADSKRRVEPGKVVSSWYTARLINPQAESIDDYAADIMMRVMRVDPLKGGVKVYGIPVSNDGQEEVDESDAVPMSPDGFFVEGDKELGYLLDIPGRSSSDLGTLAAAAALVEV